ncbi:MAG: ribbon-helix-helix protein, CopG family [Chloroflexi bacterium]|nr:ribbon-helix-helix protein, CopG family [Chloroflexota bacterium]
MRTTVTLEPELAARLRELARERRISFKSAINSTLRVGLDAGISRGRRPYREETRDLRLRPGVDLSKALQVAAALEDEETSRQLELRK